MNFEHNATSGSRLIRRLGGITLTVVKILLWVLLAILFAASLPNAEDLLENAWSVFQWLFQTLAPICRGITDILPALSHFCLFIADILENVIHFLDHGFEPFTVFWSNFFLLLLLGVDALVYWLLSKGICKLLKLALSLLNYLISACVGGLKRLGKGVKRRFRTKRVPVIPETPEWEEWADNPKPEAKTDTLQNLAGIDYNADTEKLPDGLSSGLIPPKKSLFGIGKALFPQSVQPIEFKRSYLRVQYFKGGEDGFSDDQIYKWKEDGSIHVKKEDGNLQFQLENDGQSEAAYVLLGSGREKLMRGVSYVIGWEGDGGDILRYAVTWFGGDGA